MSDSEDTGIPELSVHRETVHDLKRLADHEARSPGTIMVQDHPNCLISAAESLSAGEEPTPEASVSFWMEVACAQKTREIRVQEAQSSLAKLRSVKREEV